MTTAQRMEGNIQSIPGFKTGYSAADDPLRRTSSYLLTQMRDRRSKEKPLEMTDKERRFVANAKGKQLTLQRSAAKYNDNANRYASAAQTSRKKSNLSVTSIHRLSLACTNRTSTNASRPNELVAKPWRSAVNVNEPSSTSCQLRMRSQRSNRCARCTRTTSMRPQTNATQMLTHTLWQTSVWCHKCQRHSLARAVIRTSS